MNADLALGPDHGAGPGNCNRSDVFPPLVVIQSKGCSAGDYDLRSLRSFAAIPIPLLFAALREIFLATGTKKFLKSGPIKTPQVASPSEVSRLNATLRLWT
jgi:hypothetical protein